MIRLWIYIIPVLLVDIIYFGIFVIGDFVIHEQLHQRFYLINNNSYTLLPNNSQIPYYYHWDGSQIENIQDVHRVINNMYHLHLQINDLHEVILPYSL